MPTERRLLCIFLVMFAIRCARALASRSRRSMATAAADDVLAKFADGSRVGQDVPLAVRTLFEADAVCFDVDSTVIAEEGIDVLADYLGQGEAVAALTKRAMEGDTKFQDALRMRLELMKPSKLEIQACLSAHPMNLSPGIEDLVMELNKKYVDVWLVSGGFRIMIEPIAKHLGIAKANIFANTIIFEDDAEGTYLDFDATEPTSRDMGKPRAVEMVRAKGDYSKILMVGDGATDAQAKPPATAFVGFGGVVTRPAVRDRADWFVTDFEDMIEIVKMRQVKK